MILVDITTVLWNNPKITYSASEQLFLNKPLRKYRSQDICNCLRCADDKLMFFISAYLTYLNNCQLSPKNPNPEDFRLAHFSVYPTARKLFPFIKKGKRRLPVSLHVLHSHGMPFDQNYLLWSNSPWSHTAQPALFLFTEWQALTRISPMPEAVNCLRQKQACVNTRNAWMSTRGMNMTSFLALG